MSWMDRIRVWKRETTERLATVKALLVGAPTQASNVVPPEESEKQFTEKGALEPPLPLERLSGLLYISSSLRQNIEAYVTNVDSFGWLPVPTIELTAAKVRETLSVQEDGAVIDDDTVKRTLDEWIREAARELALMHNFFNYINPEKTFTELRREARLDHELLGNSAFEVVRSKDGKPALLTHVPFVTVRILPLDEQRVEIEMDRKTDAVTLGKLKIHKRFRSFVQIQESVAVFFKEFGDPRLRSAKTGMIYKDLETMKRAEPEAVPATEIWHRRIPAPNEAYGMPRWIGTLLAVFGTRLSEEVNFMYFDNKSVPPLAILVSGGRIAADSVSKIEAFVENRIKGERNFHRILILEAEAAADGEAKNNGRVQIKLVPLTDAQQSDALFQRYDARNADKVGASFRLPPILRGEARDLNRSTAEVAKALAEEQVFQPERDAFDADVNRRLLPQLGIRFWEFRTRAAGTRDPQTVSTMLAQLAAAGIVMPDEARDIAADVFGRKFEHRTEDFFRQPLRLSIASVRSKKEIPEIDRERHPSAGAIEGEQKGGDGEPTDAEYTAAARRIARLRAEVDAVQLGEEVVKVPRREFESWLAQPGATPNGK